MASNVAEAAEAAADVVDEVADRLQNIDTSTSGSEYGWRRKTVDLVLPTVLLKLLAHAG